MYKIMCIVAEEEVSCNFEETVTRAKYYKLAGYENVIIATTGTNALVDIYRNGSLVYHKPKRKLDRVISVIANGKCGQCVYYELNELGVLHIYGHGATFNFNKLSRYETDTPWEAFRYNILKVEVEEGVTRIGSCVFANCADLEYVKLPDTLVELGSEAFSGCSNLLEIQLPKRIKMKGINQFKGCVRLRKVIINLARQDYYTEFNYD